VPAIQGARDARVTYHRNGVARTSQARVRGMLEHSVSLYNGVDGDGLMTTVLGAIVACVAIGAMIGILTRFRRQRDIESGPGIVPEDYD
jgi:hypothetical protein